ncbi:MAG: long-chain fatty acid--CoA ligase [Chitinophagaceae bacterium]|nr:long-chain fatty acid--CoA ligase [Chitinophagaceae bacterium]
MVQRIFDIVEKRVGKLPDSTMLAAKEGGEWRTYSSKEVWEMARKLCGGIESLGIKNQVLEPEHQEKIAIVSPNRPEWIITDIGVQMTGAVLTPLYPTISPGEMEYILKESEVRIVFIANQELYDRFKPAFDNCPTVTNIYSFDKVNGATHWEELIDKNLAPDQSVIDRINIETLATIIYTSGTTGNPKGVMLSHKNIVSNVYDSMPAFTFAERGAKTLSFLPLNHIFERTVSYIYIEAELQIYYAESMDTIGDNLREVKPLVFTTVPRLLEKVYERILGKGLELKGIKRLLFFWALKLGFKFDNADRGSWWYRFQLSIANKLIFSKWREALGNNVKAIVTGSAPCQPRLIRVFTAARIIIMEGYGLTETSPVVSVNRFESDGRRIGSIGTLIDNVEVKIMEDGEIWCRGNNIMMGYYKHPDLTKEVLTDDGWLKTGDIGEWTEWRFLKITDRKKEIFKTSGGKYVAPQPIENKLKESIFIEQLMVIGAGKKFVSALIVPAYDHLRNKLKDDGVTASANNDELIKQPEAIAVIQKQIDKFNPLFSHVEQIKKFELMPNEWTIDTGELTPSLKIKRKKILEKYASQIDDIYDENAGF